MKTSGSNPALFLDRDGVINIDQGYVHRPDQVTFCDGIFELVAAARALGMSVVVVTNQAGIGRGLYTEADFTALRDWMHARFAEAGAPVDRTYHCPCHPEHGVGEYRRESDWRKPNPGMLLQAAADLNLDLPASVLVGDNETDIQAGIAAGVRTTVLYRPGPDRVVTSATQHVRRLQDAVALLAGRATIPTRPGPQ
jgi:D-glycero-D-manno-heptose 1,7-bisphosphate phosphatase